MLVFSLNHALPAVAQVAPSAALSADQKAALDQISANSMRGHLSFIASDLLEGRDTPSRGLDLAAEYIAAQFRRAGLEPIGDDGYFQTANWQVLEPDADSFSLDFQIGGATVPVRENRVTLSRLDKLNIHEARLLKVDATNAEALAALQEKDVAGRAVVLTDVPDMSKVPPANQGAAIQNQRALFSRLANLNAALVISLNRKNFTGTGLGKGRLIDPENSRMAGARFPSPNPPVLSLHDPRLITLLDKLAPGDAATVSLSLGDPVKRPVKVRNVAGLLRGSDARLKDTYVLVTAHYDHVGIGTPVNGDKIYNGANDDGSGTVSVIELASALATLKERPKRSIVFLTFFGEEHGLLGSRYYGKHPLVPIEKTVADINLEQVGRTDSSEGPQVGTASMTGIDFSDVGKIFQHAGEAEGVKVYKHPRNSDAYFGASDNQALADLGVPAHTLCVAFAYPDYHGAADHWNKVDYANMAKIDRVVARSLLSIANNSEPPRWDENNPRARRYKKALDDRNAAVPPR